MNSELEMVEASTQASPSFPGEKAAAANRLARGFIGGEPQAFGC